jgi:predicted transcriptional regulator
MEVTGIKATPVVHLPHKHAKRHSVVAIIGTVIYCIISKQNYRISFHFSTQFYCHMASRAGLILVVSMKTYFWSNYLV